MKNVIEKALQSGMNYSEYYELFKGLVEEGRTTGESTQERIDFTKLNLSRIKRLDKTILINDSQASHFRNIKSKQTWIVISESWCGDAAQTLPILHKISMISDAIDFKIVLRDEHSQLMSAFLTNGSRSIPILIILDEDKNVMDYWGPRSKAATELVIDYKQKHGKIDAAFKEGLQVWYNNDRGQSMINELIEKMESLKHFEIEMI
jgi:hypothetical protein